jgi:hypothetical protein
MQILDAYLGAPFKTAADGGRLFFPWGAFGRGYVIPTEEDFERLRRRMKYALIVPLPIFFVAFIWKGVVGVGAIALLFFVVWTCWLHLECRRFQVTHEQLTFSENLVKQARIYNVRTLWLMEISALTFAGVAFAKLLRDTSDWLQDVTLLALFSCCAFVCARMLIAKRNESRRV